jgi:OmpA-OmpF porin, OOP family
MRAPVIRALAAAAALASAAPAAFAQGFEANRVYAGVALGQSQFDLDCSGTTACEDSDTAWKVFGGYQFSRHFALEVGYGNLGEATASTPPFGGIPAADVSIEATVWEVLAVGTLPLAERFSIYGKAGLYVADTEVRVSFAGLGSVNRSDDNTDLTFGVGLRYDFTPNLGVRAEWQRYGDVSADAFGEGDIDLISIGLVWRF